MSWLFSQALVAAYSGATCLDGVPSAPLNVMPTPQPFWHNGKTTDFLNHSLFGRMSAPLTEDHGKELLTWFLAGFPARTSVPPVEVLGLPAKEAACGERWPGSLARYDHVTASWKTAQFSLLGGLVSYSETWPRWGTMRDGECWALPMPGHLTSGNAFGLWQTPVADDACNRKAGKMNSRGEPKLSAQVKQWPTPLATDGAKGGPNQKGGKGDLRLSSAVVMWPTPQARDHFPPHKPEYIAKKKAEGHGMSNLNDTVAQFPTPRSASKTGGGIGLDGGRGSREMIAKNHGQTALKELTGGQLNPTWVEWLMGWPLGWTALDVSETAKCRNVCVSHG